MAAACVVASIAPFARGQALINFDVYPDGTAPIAGDQFIAQWAELGVIFSDGATGGPGPAGNPCSYSTPNHAAAGGLIVANFVDPCSGTPSATNFAGTRQDWCWVKGEGIDMYAYDAQGALIAHQFNAGGGNLVTFSFPTPVIARLEMFHIGQGIDDFVFNTPAIVLPECPADADGSGVVDADDLVTVILGWGPCAECCDCPADGNRSCAVDADDLVAVILAWGACP